MPIQKDYTITLQQKNMINPELLQKINIGVLMCFTAYQFYLIGKMKYGMYRCLIRWIFYKDYEKMVWLMENKHYIFSHLLVLFLMPLAIGLMSDLQYGFPLIRSAWTLALSIAVWITLTIWTYYVHLKIRQYEKYTV